MAASAQLWWKPVLLNRAQWLFTSITNVITSQTATESFFTNSCISALGYCSEASQFYPHRAGSRERLCLCTGRSQNTWLHYRQIYKGHKTKWLLQTRPIQLDTTYPGVTVSCSCFQKPWENSKGIGTNCTQRVQQICTTIPDIQHLDKITANAWYLWSWAVIVGWGALGLIHFAWHNVRAKQNFTWLANRISHHPPLHLLKDRLVEQLWRKIFRSTDVPCTCKFKGQLAMYPWHLYISCVNMTEIHTEEKLLAKDC